MSCEIYTVQKSWCLVTFIVMLGWYLSTFTTYMTLYHLHLLINLINQSKIRLHFFSSTLCLQVFSFWWWVFMRFGCMFVAALVAVTDYDWVSSQVRVPRLELLFTASITTPTVTTSTTTNHITITPSINPTCNFHGRRRRSLERTYIVRTSLVVILLWWYASV